MLFNFSWRALGVDHSLINTDVWKNQSQKCSNILLFNITEL